MTALRLVLGDQLSDSLSSLTDIVEGDVVLICEVMAEASYVPHHPKKIAFLFAAMRHFADALAERGVSVRYVRLDDPGNRGDLTGEVERALGDVKATRVIVTEPGEYRLKTLFDSWQARFGCPVEIREDDRFLCSHADFARWAGSRRQLRMEYFYRDMRQRYGILIEDDGKPTGGAWNYDKDNRKPPKPGMVAPRRIAHRKSPMLREVLDLVAERFDHHFGTLEPYYFAVTRDQALLELDQFIAEILPDFGDHQDAMLVGEAYLNHSLLSSYINAGLLLPLEVCRKAEAAYRAGRAPLNAVEGFIRQILGWREFIRGIYWRHMPAYGQLNHLKATRPLPAFFWGQPTGMACVRDVVEQTREHAYSHHIQRLMITGNFALLAGLDVGQVQEWYLAVYADAYEWVEMPNTLGMALFADGGIVGSKPYAASGKYIRKMSNFCDGCRYDPEEMTGERACPFNPLYWDFLARNRDQLEGNQRLPYVYSTWDRFTPEKRRAIRERAQAVLSAMEQGVL